MKHHVFAFLLALVVWVIENAVIGGYKASAQSNTPAGITSILPHDCHQRTDQRIINQCGGLPFCGGFCSRFDFYTSRCEIALGGPICNEYWLPTPYYHYQTNCSPTAGMGCVCNSSWRRVGGGRMYYYRCL